MFAERLRELREQRGMTQKDLAQKMGVTDAAVGMWERGQREPGLITLRHLAELFGVSTDYLLGRTDLPAPAPGHNPLYDRFPWLRRLPPAMQPDAIAAVQGGALEATSFRGAVAFEKLSDRDLELIMRAIIEDWKESQRRRRPHVQKES
jgi:transcriptional regulator with XRE-family HTH domain